MGSTAHVLCAGLLLTQSAPKRNSAKTVAITTALLLDVSYTGFFIQGWLGTPLHESLRKMVNSIGIL